MKYYFKLIAVVVFFYSNSLFAGTEAIFYVQKSQEYKASTMALYALASIRLNQALQDPDWNAFIEDENNSNKERKVAVVLDIDETVLNNSAYNAFLVKENTTYSRETWNEFCKNEQSTLILGAKEFITQAKEKGVEVFLVSNRTGEIEEATINNLSKFGLNFSKDSIMLRNEKPNWGKDKFTRYQEIAKNYRILLIIGDNMNDFVTVYNKSHPERDEIFNKYNDYFTTKWISIPNPVYGSFLDVAKEEGDLIDQLEVFNKAN